MYKVIIGFIAGFATAAVAREYARRQPEPESRPSAAPAAHIPTHTSTRSSRKQTNLQRLRELFEFRESVRNRDVVELLGVSPKTARNYCDELEAEGVIVQRGATGRDVYYTRAP